MVRNIFLTLLIVFSFTPTVGTALAGNINVGLAVSANQQVSFDQIDHTPWDLLLKKYVNNTGQVNYKTWHASAADTQALNRYLQSLSRASLTKKATKQSKLAFWINAYNALTIHGILREYPTTSIRNHTAKFFGYNLWKNLLLNVGGTPISLDSIEHKILRKAGEPRIHFAIVCASHSCPRLLNQAYAAKILEQQLTHNTKNFFANRENFQFNVAQKTFKLSAILKWFKEDFGTNQAAQLKRIAPYLPTAAAQNAALKNTVSVSYLNYDWKLNEQ